MSEWLQKKESKKTESVMEIDSFVYGRVMFSLIWLQLLVEIS